MPQVSVIDFFTLLPHIGRGCDRHQWGCGVLIGGLILPLLAVYNPVIRANRWSLFFPANAIVPTALGAALFKAMDTLQDNFQVPALVMRPSEAIEIFLYLFLLFYLILFTRRIGELEREG